MSQRREGNGAEISRALGRARQRLQRWREEHGGRGVRIPERLWALAVEAARAEGVEATAQALCLDRRRLADRLGARVGAAGDGEGAAVGGFVELRLGECWGGGWAMLELSGSEGERLRLVTRDARGLDLIALARTLWSRR